MEAHCYHAALGASAGAALSRAAGRETARLARVLIFCAPPSPADSAFCAADDTVVFPHKTQSQGTATLRFIEEMPLDRVTELPCHTDRLWVRAVERARSKRPATRPRAPLCPVPCLIICTNATMLSAPPPPLSPPSPQEEVARPFAEEFEGLGLPPGPEGEAAHARATALARAPPAPTCQSALHHSCGSPPAFSPPAASDAPLRKATPSCAPGK